MWTPPGLLAGRPAGLAGRLPLQTSRRCLVPNTRNQRQQQQLVPRPQVVLASTAQWQSDSAVHNEESMKKQELMMERFTAADTDGNGVIDKEELWALLESADGGREAVHEAGGHWMSEDEVDAIMRQYGGASGGNTLSFEAFSRLAADGILLDGKLAEYRAAFEAVDSGGNGRISATEIAQLFESLGTPLSYDRLVKIMARYDVDRSGQIDFFEFLRMFRGELLDLRELLEYIALQPPPPPPSSSPSSSPDGSAGGKAKGRRDDVPSAVAGTVSMLFSEAQLDEVLAEAAPGQLVVLMGSLTWCRPCKGFAPPYEKLSNHYPSVFFLKFNGNENEDTKRMFKDRLKARVTPTFYFFRNGKQVHAHTGANKSRLEHYIREIEAQRVAGEGEGADALPKPLFPPYKPASGNEPAGLGVATR